MLGLGYKRDPHDARDRELGVLLAAVGAAPLPKSADLSRSEVHAKDQGNTSSCTGQSTSQALRLAWLHAGIACPELSALFAYYCGRAENGDEHSDGGSYLRSVVKAVTRFGCADESAWPFSDGKVNTGPGHLAYRSAFDRRGVRGYYRVPAGQPNAVRQAVANGYPVVGGWDVSQSFMDWNGRDPIGRQLTGIVGGHAMPIVSYAADGTFRLLNSWGSGWGQNGYAVVTEGFVADGTDLWALELSK